MTTLSFSPLPSPLLDVVPPAHGIKRFAITFPAVGNDAVSKVTVALATTHEEPSDDIITLVSPLGKEVQIYDGADDWRDNPAWAPGHGAGASDPVIFDDDATAASDTFSGGVGGPIQPWEPLALMQGQRISGAWYVRFIDCFNGDTGDLLALSITITAGGIAHPLPIMP